jgi:hypothetical protein
MARIAKVVGKESRHSVDSGWVDSTEGKYKVVVVVNPTWKER